MIVIVGVLGGDRYEKISVDMFYDVVGVVYVDRKVGGG